MMEGSVIASLCFSGVASFGVVYAIYSSYSNGKKKDTDLKNNVQNNVNMIKNRLDDEDTGLSAIKKAVDKQEKHCIAISTGLIERVNTNERDIKEIKSKKRS